jgi:hypothetical protein
MLEDYSSPQKSNKDDELLLFLQIPLILVGGVAVKRKQNVPATDGPQARTAASAAAVVQCSSTIRRLGNR